MLRNRIVNGQKATDATYVAHTDLKRGMGVIKGTAGKTAFPDAMNNTSGENVFVVDRDNLPEGVESLYTDRPDVYFDNIKEGSYVLLRPYVVGESFYTDQYEAGAEVDGAKLSINSNGKWVAYEDGIKFVSRGTETVAGVQMLIVEVFA
jgi:hypothetical protein